MPVYAKLKSRYEIKDTLGQGGMGIVYKAFDTVIKRDVALKTIRDAPDPTALDTFYKECGVLASMAHPNIIEIFDLGEFEEDGAKKPYFVMPLLPGVTLETLIKDSSQRLTAERVVEIISQTCRGLQAAHERGLVHRDLKPSNIFVMEDDSVKIIDFGVAHILDTRTTMGLKGTLAYMAPEQIEMKPLSALSDIFSLGIVAYESFSLRRPFQGRTQSEMVEAILHHIPPPISDFNPAVSQVISRVIHKSLAKQPWHRFSSAREFSDILQKAFRNEAIEIFDLSRIQPRIQRAARAFEQSDYQFAEEILSELEAEGHMDPAISILHRQIHQVTRQKTILQLLQSARTRVEEQEYPLALQKLQEVLQMDPSNAEALSLKKNIEDRRTEDKIDDWFRLARQHIDNYDFAHAREALQNVLKLRPSETQALQLLSEVGRKEQEYRKIRQEKQELYHSALRVYENGDITGALSKLQHVLELERRAPDVSVHESGTNYQNFYNQVRSEHDSIKNSYSEARRHLTERNYAEALVVCNQYLTKYPAHALFQALKFDIEEQQRQELSAQIAEINRRVDAEPDLDRRVNILKEAVERYPGEYFEPALRLMRDKRDLVNSIVAKARAYEEQNQFNEALAQWEILKTIYRPYPGLEFEMERIVKRRDQQARSAAKVRWVEQIDQHMASGDYTRASELLQQAQAEFPLDVELVEVEKLVRQGVERAADAQQLLEDGQQLCAQKRVEEGLEVLRRAHQLDEQNTVIRAILVNTLVEQARAGLDSDWRSAEPLIQQAIQLDPSNSQAKSLRTLASDRRRDEFVDRCISQARQAQAAGDLKAALSCVEQGLSTYPRDFRLSQLQSTLNKGFGESRRKSLDELKSLSKDSETITDAIVLQSNVERARTIVSQYADDAEFQTVASDIQQRFETMTVPLQRTQTDVTSRTAPLPGLTKPDQSPISPPVSESENRVAGMLARELHRGESRHEPASTVLQSQVLPPQTISPQEPIVSAPASMMGTGTSPRGFELGSERMQSPQSSSSSPELLDVYATSAKESETPIPLEGKKQRGFWLVAGIAALLLIVLGVSWRLRHKTPPQALPQVPAQETTPTVSTSPIPLEVTTSPPGARIFINDQDFGVSTLKLELGPGVYQLKAELEGYEPALVPLELKPGPPPTPLDITLQPLPQKEVMQGGLPQTLQPPRPKTQRSGAAQVVSKPIEAIPSIPLLPTQGILKVKRSLANIQVSLQNTNDSHSRVITEDQLELLEGSYIVTAVAPGYQKLSIPVKVTAGKMEEIDLVLQPAKAPERDWKSAWDNSAGWASDGEWFTHHGGNFVLSTISPTAGSFTFTVWRKSKTAQWVLNYVDERNHDLFEMDKKFFYRSEVRNGKKSRNAKVAHGIEKNPYYQLQITATADSITHKIFDGQNWKALDEWKDAGLGNTNGKFGFLIPGKDQIGVSHFSFKPQ